MKHILNFNILDNLLEGFQLIDYNWRYLYVNETVARQGKSTKEELLGYTMMEKYPGIENTKLFKVLKKCMRERISDRIENEFNYPDGTKGWFELRIEPVAEGLFILSMDISERKRIENEILKLNESLEKKVALRTSELESKNKEITDSIRYAKQIQFAKLPLREEIYSIFPECFILYKPKAIVSGDFYFFHKNQKSVFLACADCTGHGVPGALMSMLCSEKLNEAVLKSNYPSTVLEQLNKGVKSSLRQSDSWNSTRDGMDIAFCSINMSDNTLRFSGANRPLWLIRNNSENIEEIKGTKSAIGGATPDSQYFDTHEVKLQQGDTFYVFTDGFVDQFGGRENKKLLSKRFKQILLEIQNKTMEDQKQYLKEFIENWRAGTEQIDDILVVGVKV